MPTFLRRLPCLSAAALLCFASLALAGPPAGKAQAPGFYRVQLGQFEVTALFDGITVLDSSLLKNAAPGEVDGLLARTFVGNPKMPTAVNAFLVNTGSELVLMDTGMGGHRGPALGHVLENLRAAGYDPAQVDLVLLTHMHGDHIGGLTDAAGAPLFPKARVLAARDEAAYWLPAQAPADATERFRNTSAFAKTITAPYGASGRWTTFGPGDVLAPGIRAVEARGHTPGHTAFAVESGGSKLLVAGDLVHAHAVQFARPGVSIDFDTDQAQAVATRRAVLKEVAAEGCLLGGMHLPFPGLGHVRADGPDSYAWVPVEFTPVKAAGE